MSGLTRPARDAVFGFFGLAAVMAAFAMARRFGAISHDLEQRGMGAAVGALLLVAGNVVPKLRLLKLTGAESAGALAGERTAGWALTIAGLVTVGLFLLAPLAAARQAAAVIGMGVVLLVTLDWLAFGRGSRVPSGEPAPDGRTYSRVTVVHLLYAVLYVLVAVSVKYLVADPGLRRELEEWLWLAFWLGYALLFAALGRRRRPRRGNPNLGGTHA